MTNNTNAPIVLPVSNPIVETLRTREGIDAETAAMLASIDERITTGYSLADAIREGSSVTSQAYGWGADSNACALSAAYLAALARGWVAP